MAARHGWLVWSGRGQAVGVVIGRGGGGSDCRGVVGCAGGQAVALHSDILRGGRLL